MKTFKTKVLPVAEQHRLADFPSFSATGSIRGMKNLYYGKGAMLVKCGAYIYNVSSDPYLYYGIQ